MKHVKTLSSNTFKEQHEEGRLRRVPDILPVRMQDILHSRKPELRKQQPLMAGACTIRNA